ncbi:hypothetical protein VSQ78_24845 [Nocardiopsis alba]|uniref:Uncharacterized protein n=1 Tax=Nocardiopsis alba TaxID=53437 RepID=A0ABV5E290_9ACTN
MSALRVRPANLQQRDAEAKAWLLDNGFSERDANGTGLVWLRDWYAADIWPDDPACAAERADVMAWTDEYRAAIGYSGPRDEAPAGGRERGDEGDEGES